MSAYVVPDSHIDALVDIAKYYGDGPPSYGKSRFGWWWGRGSEPRIRLLKEMTETELGRVLLGQNARSVGYRYRECQDPAALTYQYRPTERKYTPAEAIMAIRGYEYQSCENPDWTESEAWGFCNALFRRIAEHVIGSPPNSVEYWTISDRLLGREAA